MPINEKMGAFLLFCRYFRYFSDKFTIMSTEEKGSVKEYFRSRSRQFTTNHGSFGASLKIGPKSHVRVLERGASIEFGVPSVEVLIGIGKDHTALLIMDTDAWEALKAGEPANITSLKQFKEEFL